MITHSPTESPPAHPQPERGLGFALAGGLAITLFAMLIGGTLFAWLLSMARGPAMSELLPADTQLYAALQPNVGGVVDRIQLRQALRDQLGISQPEMLFPELERLAVVPLGSDNLGIWLGSEVGVAVRGANAANLMAEDPAIALLREAELFFFFNSKSDPQAANFLEQHRTTREQRGERFTAYERGSATIYAQTTDTASPIAAFGLIEHYVVFSNSPSALLDLAEVGIAGEQPLADQPQFAELRPGRSGLFYSDGSAAAETARAALRELLMALERVPVSD